MYLKMKAESKEDKTLVLTAFNCKWVSAQVWQYNSDEKYSKREKAKLYQILHVPRTEPTSWSLDDGKKQMGTKN